MNCPVCKSQRTIEVDKFVFDNFVTSDCKPLQFKFGLKNCKSCHHTYKIVNEALKKKVSQIYRDYTPYHSGGGKEQRIVSDKGFVSRSYYLFESIKPYIISDNISSHLDIGCGVGATLGAMNRLNKKVSLYGMDLSNALEESIVRLNNFSGFYHSLNEIPKVKKFDLISLMHTIEHIEDLHDFLSGIRNILSSSGQLIIQIPNPSCNPFDYLIIDHLHHFSDNSLKNLLRKNGFSGIRILKNLVNKEVTIIANLAPDLYSVTDHNPDFQIFSVEQAVEYLNKFYLDLKKITGKFYIFGTAISATWLYGCFKEYVVGFVDEDEDKHNKNLFMLQVKKPQEILSNEIVAIPLVGPIKSSVLKRLMKYTCNIF